MHVKRHTRLVLRRRIGGLAGVALLGGVAAWQLAPAFQIVKTDRTPGPQPVEQDLAQCDLATWQRHLRDRKRGQWLYFDFCNYDLRQARLARAQFHGDRFANCMLNGANLEGGRFADVTLERCEVRDADFRGCVFGDVSLQGCDLRRSDFRGAVFGDGTVFRGCNLAGGRFQEATLGPGAVTLVDCDLQGVDFRQVRVAEDTFLRLVPNAMWGLQGHGTVLPRKALPWWQRLYGYACGLQYDDLQAKRYPPSLQPLRSHVQPAAAATKSLHYDLLSPTRTPAK